MLDFRTDMAVELAKVAPSRGVVQNRWRGRGFAAHRIKINDDKAARSLKKPKGTYVTFDVGELSTQGAKELSAIAEAVAREFKKMTGTPHGVVLVVGLGNRGLTPDALGPYVCERVFVTRHIKQHLPELITDDTAEVCAIAPGVLGVTGIESLDVISGIVDKIKPELIIAIDSLCAAEFSRLGTSVQISDTGISPGSGLNNNRNELSKKTLGVDVCSIGVPLVTYAHTLAAGLIEQAFSDSVERSYLDKFTLAISTPEWAELIVTPKDIDKLVENSSKLIANIINKTLNKNVSQQEIEAFI